MVVEKKDINSISHEANVTPENLNHFKPVCPETAQNEQLNLKINGKLQRSPLANFPGTAHKENGNKLNGNNENSTTINHPKSILDSHEIQDANKHMKRELNVSNGEENARFAKTNPTSQMEDTSEQEISIESNDSDVKLNSSDNDAEVVDVDSGLDLDQNKMDSFFENETEISHTSNHSDVDNNSNIEDAPGNNVPSEQIVEIKLNDVKSNFNEFDEFMRLYLYIMEVNVNKSDFKNNSMDLFFSSSDQEFNLKHNTHNADEIIYKLSLNFGHEIVPGDCYVKQIKRKSIEIHLKKANKETWGAIGISPNSSVKSDSVIIDKCPPNKWTPCTIKNEFSPSNFNHLQVVKYEPLPENDSYLTNEKGRFFGYTGLDNLGNTCFMNSVLQCMANTAPLSDYFLSKRYVNDINKSNPLGHGGVIVDAFAQFLKQLWMGKQSSMSPTRVKYLIGEKITSMFMGYNQHDAQEFMSFFLDAIHEDLNKRNGNKPQVNCKKSDDDADEKELFDESDFTCEKKRINMENLLKVKADQMWKQYHLFNDSIVIDLFYGQFKSILTCPESDCGKKSIMFDPFLYVPLPIPPPRIKHEVIFFSRDEATGMCNGSSRFTLKLPSSSAVSELLNIISRKTNISTKSTLRLIQQQSEHLPPKFLNHNWLLADYYQSSFGDISSVRNRPLLLFEVFKDEQEECVELCIIQRSQERISMNDARIGLPFIVSLRKSMLTYSHFCAVLCSYASHSVSAYRPASTESNSTSNCFSTDLFSPEQPSHPFDDIPNITVPRLVYYKSCSLQANDILVPFILRKPNFNGPNVNCADEEIIPPILGEIEENCLSDDSDISEESQSTLVNSSNEEESIEDELFDDDFTQNKKQNEKGDRMLMKWAQFDNEAVLDLGNMFYLAMDWIDIRNNPRLSVRWYHTEGKTNNIDLSTREDNEISLDECLKLFNEPEVLGPQNCWRCPSCKELREATKQLSFWRLPPILVIQLKRFKMRNVIYRDKISQMVRYPVRDLDLSKYQNGDHVITCGHDENVKPIYDLYAVVNHMGDAFMGHYTAFARSFDGQLGWRHFDDCSVENVDESSVVTSNAYLLFYKCRTSEKVKGNSNSANPR